ncbi:hypothetical protein [Demequina gelatinilytica]|uniref:hypothetical protein n=1 Tax=Demequina gelatinilytica TaxID=1638980 RepID=UPI0007816480|nr:hypothetical protein [Demequina gelatinilytica]
MSNRRHSPYLVLGVPYGVSKAEASRAFAQATRRLRRMADAPYELEDLNAALHQVEHEIADAEQSIDHYRMPADAGVYVLPAGPGRLNLVVEPLARQTPPTQQSDVDAVHARAILEAAARLRHSIESSPLPAIHSFDTKG